MLKSSRPTQMPLVLFLIIIVSILSGCCSPEVVRNAPEALTRAPKTLYLLSEESSQVTGQQLIEDCSATTAQTMSLIKWVK